MLIPNHMSLGTTTRDKAKSSKAGSRESHMPRLDTIQMVEGMIAKSKGFDSKSKLWRALPKQMQYKTLTTILDYLEKSNKIMFSKDGAIMWILADNPKLRKLHRESVTFR